MRKPNPLEATVLEELGYKFKWWEISGNLDYCVVDTPNGERRVKICIRCYRPGHRYFTGVAWQLFDTVDEFVLRFSGEPHLYVLPASFLAKLWERCGRRATGSNQFTFNVRTRGDIIENPCVSLSQYRRAAGAASPTPCPG